MTVRIKICGITGSADAAEAERLGADYIGMIVDIQGSPRSISAEQAERISAAAALPVVLLMEKPLPEIAAVAERVAPHAVQLIGTYAPDDIAAFITQTNCRVWKTLRIPQAAGEEYAALVNEAALLQQAGASAIVFDTLVQGRKGGTGRTCDWGLAARLVQAVRTPVFLAGGLTAENVAGAVAAVKPFGVDVSSGVELSPGIKDAEKLHTFISRTKSA